MTPPTASASVLLDLPGAVQATGPDAGVAAHYGNPMIEQRHLLAGEAIVDLSNRAVLGVSGPDRLTWLNSITSQELRFLQPGESAETLVLDPTGHVEHAVRLVDDGMEAWLVVEAAELPALLTWLDRMRFMLRVELRDRTDEYAVIGTMGSIGDLAAASPALEPAAPNGTPLVWHDPWAAVVTGGFQYAEDPAHPGADWHWTEALVPRTALPAVTLAVRRGTVRAAGLLALEALRIAAWRPRRATEVDDRTLPHELDWLRSAVHLNKGCYRGQETVAKVHNLGHPPRRLVLLHLDGSQGVLPVHGDEVQAVRRLPDGETERRGVGSITSSAIHYELGPIALAVVKRTVPATVVLQVLSEEIAVAATQQVIVPQSAGSVAEIPRLPRLGIRTPGH
ncbi:MULTISPECIES: folate-binding protein [unclassified Cryobacterium]|uniref:CAF17-like 4Fe-4S cluster assembly/insertion protein YgfZ n=1 Tax=unclassified Cryobacterium TaxID=2649013 RepID=UPI002AB58667|nr:MULTISPECIES: folate-binding protein [unclassified Cryobacterium]MDY7528954.1 folate-binding protein [Cryobacterium sp. 10C2]MEB0200762.1 folate-binding protein [Cryobacterium sp. 5I3]MEB0285599.1 folate-binding protein [Cryobacterium sp. 10S3]MEB0290818.1 folate-binding protein [Cryobacterium sp. 10C2]MEB0304270.1 folate-binding protein [Cryobacterium sp. 10I1]